MRRRASGTDYWNEAFGIFPLITAFSPYYFW
jgi:hypothetical protein